MSLESVVVVIVWWLDLQLPVQSVPIITKVASSNPAHGEVYSIQHYVIRFASDLWQIGGFLRVLQFRQLIKLTATIYWNIVESGVKHDNPNPNSYVCVCEVVSHLFIRKFPYFWGISCNSCLLAKSVENTVCISDQGQN